MAELIWTRRYPFQAVHVLSEALEKRHGHQYFLEVSFRTRAIDQVDEEVKRQILQAFHGHEFPATPQATGENLVECIHEALAQTAIGPLICAVALQETRKNRFLSSKSEARFV